jgi:hypothetical protein
VIALPPLLAGTVQVTVACPLPGAAVTPVGAPGALGAAGPHDVFQDWFGKTYNPLRLPPGVNVAHDAPVPPTRSPACAPLTVNVSACPALPHATCSVKFAW